MNGPNTVIFDKYGERIVVVQSCDGWTFFWNDEPGFRVESWAEASRWLDALAPAKSRAAG